VLTTAEKMLNDALSTCTYDAENRIATGERGTVSAVLRVPIRSRQAVIAAAWGWELTVPLARKASGLYALYLHPYP